MKYTLTLMAALTLGFLSPTEAANNRYISKQHIAHHKPDKTHSLSDNQKRVLHTAYNIGKADGLKNPAILSGIILQESKAGSQPNFRTSRHKKAIDQTTGLGQIKVGTAKGILKQYPELKQKMKSNNLAHELAFNDEFNMSVASKYLKSLYEIRHDDDFVIAAFNQGPGGVSKRPWKLPYVKSVKNHIIKNQL
jgi:hypothetical protein